jgi:hypothetical protein
VRAKRRRRCPGKRGRRFATAWLSHRSRRERKERYPKKRRLSKATPPWSGGERCPTARTIPRRARRRG